MTLTASFDAVARLPLALFTAVGFTRPLVLMGMGAGLLSECIGAPRWPAGLLGLAGVAITTNPGNVAWTPVLTALGVTAFANA